MSDYGKSILAWNCPITIPYRQFTGQLRYCDVDRFRSKRRSGENDDLQALAQDKALRVSAIVSDARSLRKLIRASLPRPMRFSQIRQIASGRAVRKALQRGCAPTAPLCRTSLRTVFRTPNRTSYCVLF